MTKDFLATLSKPAELQLDRYKLRRSVRKSVCLVNNEVRLSG